MYPLAHLIDTASSVSRIRQLALCIPETVKPLITAPHGHCASNRASGQTRGQSGVTASPSTQLYILTVAIDCHAEVLILVAYRRPRWHNSSFHGPGYLKYGS